MLFGDNRMESLYQANLEASKEVNALGLQALNQVLSVQFETAGKLLAVGRQHFPEMMGSRDIPASIRAWQDCTTEALEACTKLSRDLLAIGAEHQGRFNSFFQREIPGLTTEFLAQAEDVAKNLTSLPTGLARARESKKAA